MTTKKKDGLNIKEFKALRNFIAELPPKACRMTVWRNPGRKGREPIPLMKSAKRGFSCGTVGCLGGWNEARLLLKSKKIREKLRVKGGDIDDYGMTDGQYFESPDISAENLGMTRDDIQELFYEYPCLGPVSGTFWKKWMLKRLDHIIETKEIIHWRGVPGIGGSE